MAAPFKSNVHVRRDVTTDLENMINPIAGRTNDLVNNINGLTSDSDPNNVETIFRAFNTIATELDSLANNITALPTPITTDNVQFIVGFQDFFTLLGDPGTDLLNKSAVIDVISTQHFDYVFPNNSNFTDSFKQTFGLYLNKVGNLVTIMGDQFSSNVTSLWTNQMSGTLGVLVITLELFT